jgi:hypothetical protein
MALAGVSMWDHEGWIVRQNVARYMETGKLDMKYLACDLSARAVPEVLRAGERSGFAGKRLTHEAVAKRFAGRTPDAWYEWNLGRSRAERAIANAGIAPVPNTQSNVCQLQWD